MVPTFIRFFTILESLDFLERFFRRFSEIYFAPTSRTFFTTRLVPALDPVPRTMFNLPVLLHNEKDCFKSYFFGKFRDV